MAVYLAREARERRRRLKKDGLYRSRIIAFIEQGANQRYQRKSPGLEKAAP